MKKVVITGGAGFIGSHLAEKLATRGHHVIVIDDLSGGNIDNIKPLLSKYKDLHFHQGNITDNALLKDLFSGVDCVFHQAAITSVPRSFKEPDLYKRINIDGTRSVLEAALANRARKIICASSSSVYGDAKTSPKTEDMIPSPLSPYADSKLAMESYCNDFMQKYDIPTICLRYFNVYGPRQNPDGQYAAVVPKFIAKAIKGESITIYGDGTQSRDFTSVHDVVRANILAAESDCSGIFNIGSGQKISINKLTKTILKLSGRDMIDVLHAPPRAGDIKHSLASIEKARCFGYEPEYSLIKGLTEIYQELVGER